MDKIPFDIEKFKAGLKPIYRNGEEPLQVVILDKAADDGYVVSVDKVGDLISHYKNGNWTVCEDSVFDLFLIPETETVLIAVCKYPITSYISKNLYQTSNAVTSREDLISAGFNEKDYDFISHTRVKNV